MNRPSTCLLCSATLLAGMAIGSTIDNWPLTTSVQANASHRSHNDALYRELDRAENPLVEASRLLSTIAKLTTPSVVHIQSEFQRSYSGGQRGLIEETGSGVIVTSPNASGYFVVTNRHVIFNHVLDQIVDIDDISVSLPDGRLINPTRIWSDKATDVAVMKIVAPNLQAARWGDSDKLEIGHMVLAMGSPFGLSQSVSLGIISAKGRRSLKLGRHSDVLNQDFLQTDAAINPGNSGGPLIDVHGRVIGINTAIASNSGGNDGIGFSIPSNLARKVVDELLERGKVQRAFLGVHLDSGFDIKQARKLKLNQIQGSRITKVYPNTPAANADLKFDDVILKFQEIDVADENHLINLVSLTPVGQKVTLVVFRDGREMTVEVLLTDRSELVERSEAP